MAKPPPAPPRNPFTVTDGAAPVKPILAVAMQADDPAWISIA